MMSGRYALRAVDPLSALKYGLVLGCVIMLLPGLLMGVALHWVIAGLVEVLAGGFFMPELGLLGELYQMGWGLVLRTLLVAVITGGVTGALSGLLAALLYDVVAALTGGLIIHADLLEQTPVGYPASAPAVYSPPPAALPTLVAPPIDNPPTAASPTTAASAWLVALNGTGQRWPLRLPVATVGSSPTCDVALPNLAPQHIEIRQESGRFILYDHSGGQTWVNGRQITTANMLKDGFAVKLGEWEFVFQT